MAGKEKARKHRRLRASAPVGETGFEGDGSARSSPVVEGNVPKLLEAGLENSDPDRPSANGAVALSHDLTTTTPTLAVCSALSEALASWVRESDTAALKKRLGDIIRLLEEPPS